MVHPFKKKSQLKKICDDDSSSGHSIILLTEPLAKYEIFVIRSLLDDPYHASIYTKHWWVVLMIL